MWDVRQRDPRGVAPASTPSGLQPTTARCPLARRATHEAVAEAAAIGVPDEQFGQRLRAFVVLRSGQQATEQDLQDHVKANLARYTRYKVPREVAFVDELPHNSTGKALKRELAAEEPAIDKG
jgi:acyl-coenzyme A synthetase/AMP-(fatty) acid ligase